MDEVFWWFRIRGTVLVHIWWQVLGMMLYTAGIVAINDYTDVKLGFGQTIIPVIGAVVSLLMGFRTNSAYSRYWDGRTLWSLMTKNIRTLVLLIWTNVDGIEPKDLIEKKSVINLCMAFAIGTKHYLRDEFSYSHEDIKGLIHHLNKYYDHTVDGSSPYPDTQLEMEETKFQKRSLTRKNTKDQDVFFRVPTSAASPEPPIKSKRKTKLKELIAYDYPTPTNIPLEILCYLFSYINHISKAHKAESFTVTGMSNACLALLESLTNFERVRRTPIPLAYSIHLHHVVWLYLLAVPFQFVASHGWGTIFIVAAGAFCMLGILSIAYEIEDPFGYDDNDLPLDDYCIVLKREIELITGHKAPTPDDWILSSKNQPFKHSADCDLTAAELGSKSPEDIQNMFLNNAKNHYVLEDLKRKTK